MSNPAQLALNVVNKLLAQKDSRIDLVLSGKTVVANVSKASPDKDFIEWAEANGYFVYVGDNVRFQPRWKRSVWFNPDKMGKDKSEARRNAVCDAYEKHLNNTPELLARLPELRGKVLGCWCYPLRCHGHYLAGLANAI
jgi:hypothetical protein